MSNLISLFLNSIQGSIPFLVNIRLLKTLFPLISYFWTNLLKLLANGNVIFFFGCPTSLKHFLSYSFPLYFALSYNIVYYSFSRGQSFNPFFYRNHAIKWLCSFTDMILRNSRINREDLASTMSDGNAWNKIIIHSIPTEKAG